MSFFGRMTSDKVGSNPKELAHQFVEVQKEIYDELCAIR